MTDIKAADLKRGDVISVIRVRQNGQDEHIPSVVTMVSGGGFGARALRGDFDNGGGHDLVWLDKNAKGRTWQ